MKKKLILITIILIFLLNIFFITPVKADKIPSILLDSPEESESFLETFNPDKAGAVAKVPINTIQTVVNRVLGIIQIIGGILTLVAVAIFGFNRVLSANSNLSNELGIKVRGAGGTGSPETRFVLLAYGRSMVIGGLLLFSSTTIVRIMFNIFY